jgi:trimethylamine--corrinoid protein Co-methyltransferase
MSQYVRPTVRFLTEETIRDVEAEAKRILEEIGVFVEHERARELLLHSGAREGPGNRLLIGPDLVDRALATAPSEVLVYDREGENPIRIGGDNFHFDPGSAAIRVYDWEQDRVRPSTTDDCVLFAKLTDRLDAMALQSTCVVPDDVPLETADRTRLYLALKNGRKGVITGTFAGDSFEVMRRMLVAARGSEDALRQKPLAIFDCCPSPPLEWSELTCAVLVRCAEEGIPAELVSMPMTGATAPVTLLGAVAQHTAEDLSGVVIHQLAGPGSPIIYGGSPSAFDMRHGTTPMGAVETMMIDSAYAQVGRHLGLPTHAYMGLSDSKTPDWQAGFESGCGALLAALSGVNMISGPGMLDFESCQSPEKLVLDNEACRSAIRAVQGIERREGPLALPIIREGIAAEQFLALDHTRKWFRKEIHFPGPEIDRAAGDGSATRSRGSAAERAHAEVQRLLAEEGAPPPGEDVLRELDMLIELPPRS